MDNQLTIFDPIMTLVASNIKGREANPEESLIIDSAWVNAESSIRALAWLSREGKTWKNLTDKNGEKFTSFEQYGKERFGYESSNLHNLANAYRVQNVLSNMLDKELPIRSSNQLNKLSDDEIPIAFAAANQQAIEDGVKLATRHVEEQVKKLTAEKLQIQNSLEVQKEIATKAATERNKLKQENELLNNQLLSAEKIKQEEINFVLSKERLNAQKLIDGAKAQIILENQNELQRVRSEAGALQKQLESLKKQQDNQVTARVSGELAKLELEIQAKENAILNRQSEIDRLLETKKALDKEVGCLQIHNDYLEQVKLSVKESKVAIDFVQESTDFIPEQSFKDWVLIANALQKLSENILDWTERQGSIIEYDNPTPKKFM